MKIQAIPTTSVPPSGPGRVAGGTTIFQQEPLEVVDMSNSMGISEDFWEKFFPDPDQRAAAQASLAQAMEEMRNQPQSSYTIDENGLVTQYFNDGGPIEAMTFYRGDYDAQGLYVVNQLINVVEANTLRLPQEVMLTQHLRSGQTTLNVRTGVGDWVGMDTPADIPQRGFLQTGVARYKDLYQQIRGYAENDVSQETIKRTINELDRAFGNYLTEAFQQAGLSQTAAREASDLFGLAFRTARNAGSNLDASYRQALSELHQAQPELRHLT